MIHRLPARVLALVLAVAAVACSSSSAPTPAPAPAAAAKDAGGPAAKPSPSKAKASASPAVKKNDLRSAARGKTPPAGATPKGKQTKPTLNGATVPIAEAEVYVYEADVDGDGSENEVFWAHDEAEGATFVWFATKATCESGGSDETAAMVVEVQADGSGSWLLAADACDGTSGFVGCDFDAAGNDTTCGACEVTEHELACATES
jgi:hypothetical protein